MNLDELSDQSLHVTPSPPLEGIAARPRTASCSSKSSRISLKQWRMFHAVIDSDGFAGAADELHVSQSSISHALAKIQEQLGVSLLSLKGRKAQLTDEGKILLERSRDLVRASLDLEALAENLRQGCGTEIRLASDPSFPSRLLLLALDDVSSQPRRVRLSVTEATRDQAGKALQENTVDLAISTRVPPGLVGNLLIDIEYVAVACPGSALFALNRALTSGDLQSQFQVAISDSNDYIAAATDGCAWRYPRLWNVSSLDRALSLLRHGDGYAWLPRFRVQAWLDDHRLRILPLIGGSSYHTPLYLTFGRSALGDAGAMTFAAALQSCSRQPL